MAPFSAGTTSLARPVPSLSRHPYATGLAALLLVAAAGCRPTSPETDMESTYVARFEKVIAGIKASPSARNQDGTWMIDVPGVPTPAVIQKKDGSTLYLTRDIAAAFDRFERFKFDKMFYIISEQQRLHFQLLFGVLKELKLEWGERCEHLSFGMSKFDSSRASPQDGHLFLDDLIAESGEIAAEECKTRVPEIASDGVATENIGVGALVFGSLGLHRKVDLDLRWEKIIDLEGDTGPCVQLSLVRCRSILEKARAKAEMIGLTKLPANYLVSPEEEDLLLELGKLRSVLFLVLSDNETHHLIHYLVGVAKALNRFYYKWPVLQASDPEVRATRLTLIAGAEQVLSNGLRLLGIGLPGEK